MSTKNPEIKTERQLHTESRNRFFEYSIAAATISWLAYCAIKVIFGASTEPKK